MRPETLGVLAGLGTAALWTATSLIFESASRKLGSLRLNLVRLVFALVYFVIFSFIRFGSPIAPGIDAHAWLWLGLSGLVGFVIGDLCLFEAFVLIGAPISMLVYSSVPFITAILGFVFLGETMRGSSLVGMALCVAGIILAIAKPRSSEAGPKRGPGILLAFFGSAAQALGLILSRIGQGDFDPFSATEVRVIPSLVGFAILLFLFARFRPASGLLHGTWRNPRGHLLAALGAVIGPFLGVSLGLLSAQNAGTGIASTLMALVPIYLVLIGFLIPSRRPGAREIAGAVLAVGGVAVISLL